MFVVYNLFLIRIILTGHSETGQYINQNKYTAQQIVLCLGFLPFFF